MNSNGIRVTSEITLTADQVKTALIEYLQRNRINVNIIHDITPSYGGGTNRDSVEGYKLRVDLGGAPSGATHRTTCFPEDR